MNSKIPERPKSFPNKDDVLSIVGCLLQMESANKISKTVISLFKLNSNYYS